MSWTHDDGDSPWFGMDGPLPPPDPEEVAAAERRWEVEQRTVQLLRDAGLEVSLCTMQYPAAGERHADGIEHPMLDAVFATPCTELYRKPGAELFYGRASPRWANDTLSRPELVAVVLDNGETQVYWRRSNRDGEIEEMIPCANFE